MNLSRTNAKKTARPTMETLEARDCPAFTTSIVGDVLTVTITPNNVASQSVRIEDNGTTGVNNIRITETINGSPRSNTPQGAFRTINIVSGLDRSRGGVTYTQLSPLTAGTNRLVTFSGNHLNNAFVAELAALRNDAVMDLAVSGNGGGDRLTANVRGGLDARSRLNITMEGNNGWDEVFVDAATHAPRVAADATMNVDLAGMSNGYAGQDSDNNVGFGYAGELDGRVNFNLTGGVGNDWIGVNLDLRAGSTGKVGNGDVFSARMFGDQGNDQLQYRLYSYVPNAAAMFANWSKVYIDGYSGTDTVRLNGPAWDTCLEYNNEGPVVWVQ